MWSNRSDIDMPILIGDSDGRPGVMNMYRFLAPPPSHPGLDNTQPQPRSGSRVKDGGYYSDDCAWPEFVTLPTTRVTIGANPKNRSSGSTVRPQTPPI
ncbi:hypothetical protein BASA60_003114 [Batrachochytrium salamandrivorans]|nr:hypothetical protein BASA60_003114 [Batrachochytrium salamandrivorans]